MPKNCEQPIDVYCYSHDRWGYSVDISLLDDLETLRYKNFKGSAAGECFAQTRSLLKNLLAERLQCDPIDILLDISASGKPTLSIKLQPKKTCSWYFSLSHSQQSIVIAISQQNIGIDVDMIARSGKPYLRASRLINPHVGALIHGAEGEQQQAFSHYWCAMEAYVKLKGTGIAIERQGFTPHLMFTAGSNDMGFLNRPASFATFDGANRSSLQNVFLDKYDDVALLRRVIPKEGSESEMIALAFVCENEISSTRWYQWDGEGFVNEND